MSPCSWDACHNVLCIRLDSLGDVLMTTPAIRAIKETPGERRVTLLTSSASAAVVPLIPEIDDCLAFDAPWMKATAPRADGPCDMALIDELRQRRFDAVAIFTVYSQSALPAATYCYLAGIPRVVAHCRENPYQLVTHCVRESEPENGIRHEVRRHLDLVQNVGFETKDQRLSCKPHADDCCRVQNLLKANNLKSNGHWIVVHPGASAPSRRYPPDLFADVVRRLVSGNGCRIVMTGTKSEKPLVDEICRAAGVPIVSLAGKLRVGELAALIEASPLLISNNSGPVHLAAALQTPVVDIYAQTNPQHTPWLVPNRVVMHDVSCKYCYRSQCPEGHHDCLQRIAPEEVVSAALELLEETRGAEPESEVTRSPSRRATHIPSVTLQE